MASRAFAVSFALAVIAGCQCGPQPGDLCAGTTCASPLVCEPSSGRCVLPGAGGGGGSSATGGGQGTDDGGSDAGRACAQTCSGTTPVCDEANGRCAICTPTQGCSGATPVCQPISNGGLGKCVVCTVNEGCGGATPACDPTVFPNGACVQCTRADDCPVPGSACDLNTNTCVPGNTGGGTGGGGGGSVVFDDAGMTARCLPLDAGVKTCTTECSAGYECVSGICRLRGSSGPVQVTLRFPDAEDLDLHLVEPLPDGGTCEIYYAKPGVNPNAPPPPIPIPIPQGCGGKGWLDVDSNAACDIDNINVENIIYSPGVTPTRGEYIARVVYYQNCGITRPVPYEVEVRANGVTRWYCGQFQPGDANGGNQGAGVTITRFVLP